MAWKDCLIFASFPRFSFLGREGVSRLKRPRPYPVVFPGLISRLAGRIGDFPRTGRNMGESRIFETMGSLAFSFRPSRRALGVADRLQFRAYSGRFFGWWGVIWGSLGFRETPGLRKTKRAVATIWNTGNRSRFRADSERFLRMTPGIGLTHGRPASVVRNH